MLENRNTLVASVPWMNGVKTGHTQTAGLHPRRLREPRRACRSSASCSAPPSEAARNADTLALMRYGFAHYTRAAPLVAGRAVTSLPVDGHSARARIDALHTVRVVARRGERLRTRLVGLPKQLTGPLAAGTARRCRVDVIRRGRVVASAPLVTASAVAAASFWHRNAWAGPTLGLLVLCAIARRPGSYAPCRRVAPRRSAGPQKRARVIITVTLNAAIDKSLSVPNFRLGRRHRTVEQRTMPGGKGVNVARTLKTLGQPVIATGFAGGATGTRIVEQLTAESILNDFVRIGEESRTNTVGPRPDDRHGDRDQRARPGGHAAGGRAVPRQAPVPRARRRHLRLRRLAAARRRARRSTPSWSASCAS